MSKPKTYTIKHYKTYERHTVNIGDFTVVFEVDDRGTRSIVFNGKVGHEDPEGLVKFIVEHDMELNELEVINHTNPFMYGKLLTIVFDEVNAVEHGIECSGTAMQFQMGLMV